MSLPALWQYVGTSVSCDSQSVQSNENLRGYFRRFPEVNWETDNVVESVVALTPLEGRRGVLCDRSK